MAGGLRVATFYELSGILADPASRCSVSLLSQLVDELHDQFVSFLLLLQLLVGLQRSIGLSRVSRPAIRSEEPRVGIR